LISLNLELPIDRIESLEEMIFSLFTEKFEGYSGSDIEQELELVKGLLDGKDEWTILWKPKQQREAILQTHSLDDAIRWASGDHKTDDLGGRLTELFVAQEQPRRYSVEGFQEYNLSPPLEYCYQIHLKFPRSPMMTSLETIRHIPKNSLMQNGIYLKKTIWEQVGLRYPSLYMIHSCYPGLCFN